ncbi:hypothetical protein J2792_002369 [Novosphingobium capsulatum]|uniref:Uncharacterized protein n=1 Tax=Novosphingobium capsulatum TaxID=13688 RepID=A0ABU1MMK2_9SPHN|nr:hypothetical protein [Novosphingobium capsulatum]MDR6511497.1 hypothetical protein [Novosphingobium capsulatum]
MSDWQPGDLALCIDGSDHPNLGASPVKSGSIHTVEGVIETRSGIGLFLVGVSVPSITGACRASRFVKITPGTEIKGREVEKHRPVKVDA